ncbi:hypothetical protein UPYG_G00282880 [Umbra pygmaea]|uniref:Uncharacterized protein n=1 Tax=Umbra pygmaea TaxID=75934 RepID=A0ABD0W825_UMBPY
MQALTLRIPHSILHSQLQQRQNNLSIFVHHQCLLGSSALNRIDKVLTNKRYLGDVEKLSHHYQTSTVELFHSVIQWFAPKKVVFFFIGLLCSLEFRKLS